MDYKIIIDPGHGGNDPGASGNGIIEKDLTLKISNYMYNRFKELGIPVFITRSTDETLSPTERVNRIKQYAGNDKNVVVVSNHINAGGGDGAEVVYALRNGSGLSEEILNSLSQEGQNIRKYYQRRLPSDTSKDYYFIHRLTPANTEPVLVEYGFLDSTKDDVNQLKNNWQNYAEAVVRAIATEKGLNYVPVAGSNTYVVQRGDSLYSIARKYGTTVDELKSLNNLSSNELQIGQILKLPTNEQDGEVIPSKENTYKVVAGDSLYSIAQKYDTTVDELKKLNNLTSNTLSIGQILKVPSEEEEETPVNYYTVKRGDSLYSIAQKYNTTVNELVALNNLNSTALQIGDILKIPTGESNEQEVTGSTYTVKAGDSLYSIAQKYGTTVDELKRLNNLTSNTLSVGQVLRIPTTSPSVNYYTVQRGDSLYSIAKKFNTTVDKLKAANNMSGNLISIGQELIIPSN